MKQETKSGLEFELTSQGNGRAAENGDKVTVHYSGRLTSGKKFDSSYDRGKPFSFKLGSGQVIQGWEEGIAMMREGDKATLTIPPQLGYGDRSIGPIPAGSILIFDVELIQALPTEEIKAFDTEGKTLESTPSGLEFISVMEGSGRQAKSGDNVSVHYTGYLTDGTIFDSSIEREEALEFQLGSGMVIQGWDEGISLMKEGGKMRLIIPPQLGYGSHGAGGVIPPDATLIFDVHLVSIY